MKKLLRILLVCVLALATVTTAFACGANDNGDTKTGLLYKKIDGVYTVYGYVDDGATKVTIGKISEDVTIGRIKADAFKGNSTIKEIVVEDTVSKIDAGAFSGMNALTSIELPFVGQSANADCFLNQTAKASDKAVDGARSFGSIFGTEAYEYGAPITLKYDSVNSNTYYIPVTLDKVVVGGTKVPMYAFNGLTSVSTIELKEGITEIGEYAFANSYVSKVNIPASVETIYEGAFYSMANVKTFDIASSSALKTIGNKAFTATQIKSIVLPDTVEKIGEYAFASILDGLTVKTASKLEEITLSNSLTEIGEGAFLFCESLTTVNAPKISGVNVGAYAFDYCANLTANPFVD